MNSIKIIFKENEILPTLTKNKNLCSIQFTENSSPKNSEIYFPFLPVELLGISSYYYQNKNITY
ncbi:PilZN3 domain-containing protein (plasmid) [Borreliella americana]